MIKIFNEINKDFLLLCVGGGGDRKMVTLEYTWLNLDRRLLKAESSPGLRLHSAGPPFLAPEQFWLWLLRWILESEFWVNPSSTNYKREILTTGATKLSSQQTQL